MQDVTKYTEVLVCVECFRVVLPSRSSDIGEAMDLLVNRAVTSEHRSSVAADVTDVNVKRPRLLSTEVGADVEAS
jgi:hypothetical protein